MDLVVLERVQTIVLQNDYVQLDRALVTCLVIIKLPLWFPGPRRKGVVPIPTTY
jgi:hypothetical protein